MTGNTIGKLDEKAPISRSSSCTLMPELICIGLPIAKTSLDLREDAYFSTELTKDSLFGGCTIPYQQNGYPGY